MSERTALVRVADEWLAAGVVLGSVGDFGALAMFCNLRAAGAQVIFYDEQHGARLKTFADAWLAKLRTPGLGKSTRVNIWTRKSVPRLNEFYGRNFHFEGIEADLSCCLVFLGSTESLVLGCVSPRLN